MIPRPQLNLSEKRYAEAWREWVRAMYKANSFIDDRDFLEIVMKASNGCVNPRTVIEVCKEETS